ncbi:MAG: rRNA maturation RNase YbeY [Eubacterium sp.]|nr:rRNA maturation RNase YbeY [Eubacterium sp.]
MSLFYENTTEVSFVFDEETLIHKLLTHTMSDLKCPYEVSVDVTVVDEDEIQRLNREFREMDRVTDVLSFPMNEFDAEGCFEGEAFEASMEVDPETEELLLGDVILCAQKVKSQADEYGHSEEREFAFLVVHSLLHLCGYDHIDDADRQRMEAKQSEILDELNINR